MKFVIFHGAFGNPQSNWLPELKAKLEMLGQEVIAPNFPVDSWDDITAQRENARSKKQSLEKWLEVFKPIYQNFKKGDKLCFVGHSLGSLFILHVVDKFNIKLDSAIFVCPFLQELKKVWQIDVVNHSFYKTDFNFKRIRNLIPLSYAVYTNNDPYVANKYSIEFGQKMQSSIIRVEGLGHMNSEIGLIDFPLILELCKTRLGKEAWVK